MNRPWLILGLLSVALSLSRPAHADLVSPYGGETAPNFAELMVMEDRVRVALEIDLADYPKFVAEGGDASDSLSERTGRTLAVAADGVGLEPVTRIVDLRDRKPRVSAARPMVTPLPRSDKVVYAELEFPFEGRPQTVTFTPPLDQEGMPVASIGMLAEQLGVPVTDYRYLSQAETLVLDWQDPWFSAFENPNLTRHHKSPLMSFITMEPREVRHEIIVRLRDLEGWVDLGLGDARHLSSAQMDGVKRQAAAFFAERNPLVIDGEPAQPADVRVSGIAVDVSGLRVLEASEALDRTAMLLGVILSYPRSSLPAEVAMTWELFPRGLEAVPVQLIDPAGGVPSRATTAEPRVTWNNVLKTWEDPTIVPVQFEGRRLAVPILTLGCLTLAAFAGWHARSPQRRWRWAGLSGLCLAAAFLVLPLRLPIPLPTGTPGSQAAATISQDLLRNAATALLETEEQAYHRALTGFVAPDALPAVGAELRRGLSVTLPSGARARTDSIEEIAVEEVTRQDEGVSLLTSWTAEVSGGHWGHLHRRALRYRALMDVMEDDGTWKLRALTVLSARPNA